MRLTPREAAAIFSDLNIRDFSCTAPPLPLKRLVTWARALPEMIPESEWKPKPKWVYDPVKRVLVRSK